jgi:hypothetical protein
MWMWVYSRGPFSYLTWCLQLFIGWMEEHLWICLAVFPRHKGRNNLSLFFLFGHLLALINW